MEYKKGKKYQLWKREVYKSKITGYDVKGRFWAIHPDGRIVGKAGYAWDGASGPTYDNKTNMRAALFHDIGYQAIRERKLPMHESEKFDHLLYNIMVEDGAFRWRAWYYKKAMSTPPAKMAAKGREKVYVIKNRKQSAYYIGPKDL